MDAGYEKPLFAPHLVMRKVVRDIDSAPAEGRTSPIETLRYSLGEWPWVPELEVFEEDGWLMIHVDLPGVRPEDVSISVAGDRVQVAGERRRASSVTRKDLHAPEPTYGRFNRSVRLPAGAAGGRLAWVFENGVLQIGVPVSTTIAAERLA
jgi:HSP20 family protein